MVQVEVAGGAARSAGHCAPTSPHPAHRLDLGHSADPLARWFIHSLSAYCAPGTILSTGERGAKTSPPSGPTAREPGSAETGEEGRPASDGDTLREESRSRHLWWAVGSTRWHVY